MELFDKLKTTLSDFSKVSADTAREGMEKLGEKSTDFVVLNKAKMEKKAIEKKIEDSYTELGTEFYTLFNAKKLKKSSSNLTDIAKKINEFKSELQQKETEVNQLYSKLSPETLEKEKINSLKDLLDEGGGTIEQVSVSKDSTLVGKRLKNIRLPKQVLVGTVLRGDELIIPDGTYIFQAEDQLTLLGMRDEIRDVLLRFAPTKN